MDISVSTALLYKHDYKYILDIIVKSGCNNIELAINQSFFDVPIEEIVTEIEKRNIQVKSIHTPLVRLVSGGENSGEEYWIKKSIEYAKVLKSDVIVSHFAYFIDEKGQKVCDNETHQKIIIKNKDIEGISVCTENFFNTSYNTFLKHDDLLKDFLEKNDLSLTYDTTHWAEAHDDRDIICGYELFKDHIKNIHISDYLDGDQHIIIGRGELALDKFIKRLKDDNYDGLLTIELDFDSDNKNNIKSYEEAFIGLRESLDYIKSI